jgi:hypothetical protein
MIRALLAGLADKYDSFMLDVWPTVRWVAYAYLAVFALFFVSRPDVRQNIANNAHRVSCHVNEWAFGTASSWSTVNCEAWFYRR